MRDQRKSKTRLTARAAMMTLALIPLAACVKPGGSETERSICRELRRDLPTWSRSDTVESLTSGARFVAVFDAICPA